MRSLSEVEALPADYLTDIEKYFKETLNNLYNGKKPTNKMFTTSGKTLVDKAVESYGTVQLDFTTPDAQMLSQLVKNCWQFSAAKNYQELQDLSAAMVNNETGKLREWSDFKAEAEKIGKKFNETWMRTEYDQAITGAQSAARWVEFEQDADTIPNLQYQTVGDGFVRTEHQLLNGVVRPLKDGFWNTNYPPNGWGCRCEALQVPNDLGEITPAENVPNISIAPMFRTNLAKTGLIFPNEHPYYKGIPREIQQTLDVEVKRAVNVHYREIVEKWASNNIKGIQIHELDTFYSGKMEISGKSVETIARHLSGFNKTIAVNVIENIDKWERLNNNVGLKHARKDFVDFNNYKIKLADKEYIIHVGITKNGNEVLHSVFDIK